MTKLSVDTIFQNAETKHGLTLFEQKDMAWIETQLFEKSGKPYIKCLVKDIDRPAKPEEIVRQLYLRRLLTHYNYLRTDSASLTLFSF
jgi:type I restriction enzyme M protein